MDMRLDGKVALVTGGSRGIGRAIATAFAGAGARVMICSRKADSLEEAAASMPGEVVWHVANAGDPEQARATIDDTIERLGGLDVLVNNAATNPYMGPLMGIDASRAEKTVQVNQLGVLTWTQLAWKTIMSERGGNVINIASTGGFGVTPGIAYYSVTKAAVIHLTKQMAQELGPKVRVNAIAPGLVRTDMAKALVEHGGDAMSKRLPLRRIGEPEDIAGPALFLASDASAWVTGVTIPVDGGAMVSGGAG
ncbi:MAG TPA: SDR family oxidoreductase [Acidimicrobiales bacterium]|nr:SDR family oxidoreductase [Acidimicrobiales bacterium]